ncbi:hypothetical protein [Sphingobacterium lactis]|uniref:Uncharacterized protein n=1 Tax=Sphingobacterium lactis TaxID=797291 RepID=A0A1H5WEA6_9SPHI|nr:hypothetical protein [Sphingobacterium lactis]SEF97586.1 hypothetical protein SAMN05421877_10419 [Sphingobacterium lactis]
MENSTVERPARHTDNNANRTEYYVSLTVAIVIGLVGVFIRFVPDVIPALDQMASIFSWIANIAIIIASYLAFKIVFAILGFSKK